MRKRMILSLICLLCIALPIFTLEARAESEIAGGSFGDNLYWSLSESYVLTISGQGSIKNFSSSYRTPWSNYNSAIEEIIIQPGITHIGTYSFTACYSVRGISLPEGLLVIGDNALPSADFYYDIPASVEHIGENNLYYRVSAQNPYYSSDDAGCLYNRDMNVLLRFPNNFWVDYVMPDSVERVESGILDNYFSGLNSITLSPNVYDLGDLLENYEKPIRVPKENPYFSNDAYGCLYNKDQTVLLYILKYNLHQYVMPDTLERVEQDVFPYSSNLRSLTLSPNLYDLGNLLENYRYPIYVPDENPWFSGDDLGVLYDKGRTILYSMPRTVQGEYTVPATVRKIGDSAFMNSPLTQISLPQGLLEIGAYAFESCKIEKLEIPASVETIGYGGLNTLRRVSFLGDVPDMEYAFDWISYYGCTVYYDADNATWTEDVRNSFDSEIVWIPYHASNGLTGTCGKNLTYSIDADLEILTISGSGRMDTWDGVNSFAPWVYYSDLITVVQVGEDVTSLDGNAFLGADVTAIHFAGDVPFIGQQILEMELNIYYPAGAEDWEKLAAAYADSKITWICQGTTYADLQAILDNYQNMTPRQIRDAVQALDRDDLLESMRSGEITDSISTLHYAISGYYSDVVIMPGAGGLQSYSMISATGLFLNNPVDEAAEQHTVFDTVSEEIPVPEGYRREDMVQFSLSMENVQHPENLDVPVIIGIPYDQYANAFFVDVFWRNPETGEIEHITDRVRWTKVGLDLQFVVTGAGDYAIFVTEPGESFGGSCGDGLTWTYEEDGTLTISGSGVMDDYHPETNPAPWDYYRENVTQIILGDQVQSIGSYAFYDCRFTSVLDIPSSIRRIGEGAFYGLYDIRSMTFRGDAPEIEENAFYEMRGTAYYPGGNDTWTETIQSIYGASDYDFSWVEIAFSGSCGEGVFWSYDEATATLTVSGSGKMDDFDYGSWGGAPWCPIETRITRIVIEEGITRIGYAAFPYCYALEEIRIADSVTEISDGAIYMGNMESFTVPANVTNLSPMCGIASVKKLLVDPNNPVYCAVDNVLFTKDMKTLLLCPETKSGDYSVPDGVTVIANHAITNVRNITSITFPESLDEMELYALSYCPRLSEITFRGNAPIIGESALEGLTATAYYPAGNDTWTEEILQGYGGIITWIPYEAADDSTVDSGSCGENLTWTLDKDGILTISGTGAMPDYSSASEQPWHNYSTQITALILDENMTTVGSHAFSGLEKLPQVKFPNITKIGEKAFYGCNALTSVTMPDSVKTVGKATFSDCEKLGHAVLPRELEHIPDKLFQGCVELKTVTYPEKLVSIGDMAFGGCYGLYSPVLPEGLKTIGNSAFAWCGAYDSYHWYYDCSNFQSVTLPSTLESIGDYAFFRCENLNSVIIPDNVVSIGAHAFAYCWDLSSAVISANIETIGSSAFFQCKELTEATFNWKAPEILDDAFGANTMTCYYPSNNPQWTEEKRQNYGGRLTWVEKIMPPPGIEGTCGENLTWTLDKGGILTISGTGDMPDYSSASEQPWYPYRSQILEIIIDDRVTSIGERAFYGCNSAKKLTIGAGVAGIEKRAFYDCTALEEIRYNAVSCSSLITENYAFTHAGNKTDGILVTIGANVTKIPGELFCSKYKSPSNAPKITKVVFEEGSVCKIIDYRAFANCEYLREVEIPESVIRLGIAVFEDCSRLTRVDYNAARITGTIGSSNYIFRQIGYIGGATINIGPSVQMIPANLFCPYNGRYSPYITAVNFSENSICTEIGDYAFGYNKELTEITLPDSITTIGKYAFVDCRKLTILCETLPENLGTNWRLGTGLCTTPETYGIEGDFSYWIENGEAVISRYVGSYLVDDDVTVPNQIGGYPVTALGDSTFYNDTSLEKVTLPETLTSIGEYTFAGCSNLPDLDLPASVSCLGNYFLKDSGICTVHFRGDAPEFAENAFSSNVLTASYPAGNTTWTSDIMHNYGGTVTWVPDCADDHQYSVQFNWQKDFTCTADFTCSICEESQTLPCDVTAETIPATEQKDGQTVYTATVVFNEAQYSDTQVVIIPKLDHTTHTPAETWYMDSTNHWRQCTLCKETIDLAKHIPGSTSEEDGSRVCTVCGYIIHTPADLDWFLDRLETPNNYLWATGHYAQIIKQYE